MLSIKLTKHVSPNQFLLLFCQSFLYLKIDFGALSCYQRDRYILGWADTGLGELLVTPSINIRPSFLCTMNTNNNTLHCLVCSLFPSLDRLRLERVVKVTVKMDIFHNFMFLDDSSSYEDSNQIGIVCNVMWYFINNIKNYILFNSITTQQSRALSAVCKVSVSVCKTNNLTTPQTTDYTNIDKLPD